MQAAQAAAEDRGDAAGASTWRLRLHTYLDALFKQDPAAGSEYHDLQASLEPDAIASDVQMQLWAFRLLIELPARCGSFVLGKAGCTQSWVLCIYMSTSPGRFACRGSL